MRGARLFLVEASAQALGIGLRNLAHNRLQPELATRGYVGIDNSVGSRIKVVQIPIYLRPDDEFLHREYEAVLAAMDLGIYPSFYEPWGYTPQEALAVGVPTITTDLAGFGRWAESAGWSRRLHFFFLSNFLGIFKNL